MEKYKQLWDWKTDKKIIWFNQIIFNADRKISTGSCVLFSWTGWFMSVTNLDSKDKLITLLSLLLISISKKRMTFPNLSFNLLVQPQCLLLPNFNNLKLWVQETFQNLLTIDTPRCKLGRWNWKYAGAWVMN